MATRFRPYLEDLETRIVPSFADGNGAVVTNLAAQNNGAQLVITFDGPLNAGPINPVQSPTNIGNYSVQVPSANPEVVTSSTSSVSITSATYNSGNFQVTLNLASPLAPGAFYRVFINGVASSESSATAGLVDQRGNAIDGDYDDTASGNFYALFAWTTAGTPLLFSDSGGDSVTLTISGPGNLDSWRALDGDFVATNLAAQAGLAAGAIQQLTVLGGVLGQTTLSGSAIFATGNSVVVVPAIDGQGVTFTDALPPYFQLTAPPLPTPPTPVIATSSNLPYTLQIQQVSSTLPAVQSPVAAQDNLVSSPFHGYWLMFGGRTNGLHNFNPTNDFPPQMQNQDIFVVNPATWQTWTVAWSATDVPTALVAPLYSTNQQSFQEGDTLYAVGGYGAPEQLGGTFGSYTTYDTLTALSVDGLIAAVVNGAGAAALSGIQQIQDPRLQVTGGAMQLLGSQALLVLGQDFQGEYFSPTATQTYTDEIRSFQISYNSQVAGSLGIANFQVQNDQVNFRRRDYDLGNIIQPNAQAALEVFGGVFTPGAPSDPTGGQGYRTPIVVSGVGATQVSQYQQFFNQYSAANVGLYDARTQSMFTVFLGGISLYDYNFATGQLTSDTELPFVDDVTTLMQGANGASQEYEMPSQLPGLYGAEASFFATPGLPQYANGVIQLDGLSQATTLGYMFGGIHSTVPNTTDPASQTSATGALFRVVLVPVPQSEPSPTTYTVTSLADSATGAGNSGTLRYVLNLANANHTGSASTPDHILFATGAGTINVGSQSGGAPLPALASNEVAIIDATTATGYTGTPVITLDGTSAILVIGANGLTISGGSSTIKGFDIVHFSGNGIQLDTNGGDTVLSSYIGITTAGAMAGNGGDGIFVAGTANNVIGSTTAIGSVSGLGGNVLSGNGGNGVRLSQGAQNNTVAGNYIGTDATGTLARGNGGDGIQLAGASNNTIGNNDPVTGVNYNNSSNFTLNSQPVTGWQGLRGTGTIGQYLIAGTAGANGLLFEGTMTGVGTSYAVNFPNAANTSVYGPDDLGSGVVRLVGSYRTSNATGVTVNGFMFQGTTANLGQSADYTTIDYPGAVYNYVHSTMGGFAVGNYDSPSAHGTFSLPLGPGHAYIYDVATHTFLPDIVFPGSTSDSAYGIWYNGGTSYTICGGYSDDALNNFTNQSQPFGLGYLVNYDSATGIYTNWASYSYPNGSNFVTHFEGISSVENGVYTLSADSGQIGGSNPVQGSWVTVHRNSDGSFGAATWVNLNYPGIDPTTNVTSSNSVYGNQVIGIVIGPQSGFPFQAAVNIGFQLSNVISANGGNGISLLGADNNQIAMNYIGTDTTGTRALGNAGNGILATAGSMGNLIGGSATGGNDPTNAVFVRPPQGNLISGNNADGVLVTGAATLNTLSGNFIGTAASGISALGNTLDGVAIDGADNNALIGCTFQTSPFVYYNVIGGNGGNGLRVTNSNSTTIQANFFGVGADNNTPVGNGLNGVLVGGTSAGTLMGGPIPLGNVDAANGLNGILVQDSASGFTSYNTFCGLAAFTNNASLGNGGDGMLITSSGANILIRTNIVTRNGNDGIEIGGAANGVRVVGNIIGLNASGVPMGNLHNGVEVDGNASNITIGGPQPTFNIIPVNIISANGGDGVAINGNAANIQVNSSYIGTNFLGTAAIGNANAGIFLGAGTSATAIGSLDPTLPTVISGNLGNGIEMRGTHGNTVVGCLIGTDVSGVLPLPNAGNGVYLGNSSNNTIGRAAAGIVGPVNTIAFNGANGVLVNSGNDNGILDNSIYGNILLGIDLGPSANMNQTSPVLTSAVGLPRGMQVTGILTSLPDTLFRIEFFANDVSAPSGRYLLGFQNVTTNSSGSAAFTFLGPLPPTTAPFITATATDPNNNTSEFGPPLRSQASVNAPFTAPVANSPAAGAILTTDQPTFTWTAVSGVGSYKVWITDNNTGIVLVLPAAASATSVTVPSTSALTPGHGFTWWVGSVSSNGLTTVWSTSRVFTIAALTAPTATTPASGAVLTTDQPTFGWTAVSDAGSYKVWITDNNTGAVLVIPAPPGATSAIVPAGSALTPGHGFTWWIGSVSTNGLVTVWSTPRAFTIAALAAPAATTPTAGAILTTDQPTFGWTTVSGVGSYHLWISDNNTGAVLVIPAAAGRKLLRQFPRAPRLTPGHSYLVDRRRQHQWPGNCLEHGARLHYRGAGGAHGDHSRRGRHPHDRSANLRLDNRERGGFLQGLDYRQQYGRRPRHPGRCRRHQRDRSLGLRAYSRPWLHVVDRLRQHQRPGNRLEHASPLHHRGAHGADRPQFQRPGDSTDFYVVTGH